MKEQNQSTDQQKQPGIKSGNPNRLTLNQWFEQFKPIPNHQHKPYPHQYLFEPSGPDLERVKAAPNNTVWTLVKMERNEILRPGYQNRNFMGYFICTVAWDNADLTVVFKTRRFLTPDASASDDLDEEVVWKLELGAQCNRLIELAEAKENSPLATDQQLAEDLREIVGLAVDDLDLEVE